MDSIFKIVFHHGETAQLTNTFLGISHDVIFTVIFTLAISLGVLLLGDYLKKRHENKQELKRLREIEDYYSTLVVLLEEPLQKQTAQMRVLAQKLSQRKEQDFDFNVNTNFVIKQIQKIKNDELFAIYIKKRHGKTEEKTELFSTMCTQTAFIEKVSSTIVSDFKEFNVQYQKYVTEYKAELKITQDALNAMVAKTELIKDPFILGHKKNVISWRENGKPTDIFETKVLLIDKAVEILNNSEISPINAFFNVHIMNCVYAFNNLNHQKNHLSNLLNSYADDLDKAMLKLKVTLKSFDSFERIV